MTGPGLSTSYSYNGLEDRVQETANDVTTHFTLDLAAGLTQVLDDGTYTYLYGNGRIAQAGSEGNAYFLGDALGSVRQLVDSSGTVTLAQSYTPYGEILGRMGEGETRYTFTGEQYDRASGLIYLRARYYSPQLGSFLTRDTWNGYFSKPLSLNKWAYVEGNPINFIDPSGNIKYGPNGREKKEADQIIKGLENIFAVTIAKDYGWASSGYGQCKEYWNEGAWDIENLRQVRDTIGEIAKAMKGASRFKSAMGNVRITKLKISDPPFAPPGVIKYVLGDFVVTDGTFSDENYANYSIAHELGHVWDYRTENNLSKGLMNELGTMVCETSWSCSWRPYAEKIVDGSRVYPEPYIDTSRDIIEKCPNGVPDPYSSIPICKDLPYSATFGAGSALVAAGAEDWATSFAVYIFRSFPVKMDWIGMKSGGVRETYVRNAIANIP